MEIPSQVRSQVRRGALRGARTVTQLVQVLRDVVDPVEEEYALAVHAGQDVVHPAAWATTLGKRLAIRHLRGERYARRRELASLQPLVPSHSDSGPVRPATEVLRALLLNKVSELTARQAAAMILVVQGHSPRSTARILAIDRKTLKQHLCAAVRKLRPPPGTM